MQLLPGAMSAISIVGLALSLWLGIYVVTRSPRSTASWLAGATLWSLCLTFLTNLTYLHALRYGGLLPWWLGWSVAMAVPFWFHLTASLGGLSPSLASRALLTVVYVLGLALLAMMASGAWILAGTTGKSPLLYSAQQPGPLFPLLVLYLTIVPLLSLLSLCRVRRQASSPAIAQRLAALVWATLLATLSGAYASLAVWAGLDAPVVVATASLVAAVALLGYGVARHSALIEGRLMRHDFSQAALATALVALLYLLAAALSSLLFDVPPIAFVIMLLLAIVSHSLYEWVRPRLTWILQRRQYGGLREQLRQLVHAAPPQQEDDERLQTVLESICLSLDAAAGIVALREEQGFVVAAAWRASSRGQLVALEDVDAWAASLPPVAKGIAGLRELGAVAPLIAGGQRVGAILLGPRSEGREYSQDDMDALEETALTLSAMVHSMRLQADSIRQIDALLRQIEQQQAIAQARMRQWVAQGQPRHLAGKTEQQASSLVESGLRHLHDYSYLGTHRLAEMRLIDSFLETSGSDAVTHLERGKALQQALVEAIGRLRPDGPRPSPPGREWHQYAILHDCYMRGKPTRDVMSELFIGEGTFNRARRRAIQAIARALAEMETEATTKRRAPNAP